MPRQLCKILLQSLFHAVDESWMNSYGLTMEKTLVNWSPERDLSNLLPSISLYKRQCIDLDFTRSFSTTNKTSNYFVFYPIELSVPSTYHPRTQKYFFISLLLLILMLGHRQVIFAEAAGFEAGTSETPNRQQTECPLTNRLSYRRSSQNLNSTARSSDEWAFSPPDVTADWLHTCVFFTYIC